MEPRIGWGIIGPGRIAHRFADAVTAVEDSRLAAVGSRDVSRARAFAAEFGCEHAFGSYEEVAASDLVDAVYIATPHRFHYENARLCLEAGKHVLCEKPLTVNAGEARDLSAMARDRGLFLMEAMWTLLLPVHGHVRDWLDEGAIGPPMLMTSTFGFRAPRDPSSRLLNAQLAGGALLDTGVYNIAVSRLVTGTDPISVRAGAVMGETGVDELTAVTLRYEGDVVSQFTCTLRCDTANRFTIFGPEGTIRIEPRFWESTRAILSVGEAQTVLDRPFRHNGFEYQIEEAAACIRAGQTESAIVPHATSIGTMETMDRIREQIGFRYPFEEVDPPAAPS